MHTHSHHCTCTHSRVRYCSHCHVVHCLDCSKEWRDNVFTWGSVTASPYYGSTYQTRTLTTQNTEKLPELLQSTCKHGE